MKARINGAELLDSGHRFSVAMWEYSWLTQRSGRQAEYADWDKVLDELVERGYECIRIDAFPHLIAADENGRRTGETTFLPVADNFMWGSHESVTVNVRDGLVEFMKKMKARGLYAGLSSWFNDDSEHRKFAIHSPDDYARIWLETLDLLAENNLLDMVVWVDLCNEFPMSIWAPQPYANILGMEYEQSNSLRGFIKYLRKWDAQTTARASAYFNHAIAQVREKYPALKYTFSLQAIGAKNLMQSDTSAFDLTEPHIWATDDLRWTIKSKHLSTFIGRYPTGVVKHAQTCMKLFPKHRDRLYDILDKRTDLWADWAKQRNLPLITSEGWTSVMYEDISQNGHLGEWGWFKEVAEMGVTLAIDKGWQGICTSNFCQPHFEGMWHDVDWHRRMTDLIRQD
jgi:hypothetical protein